MLVECFYRLEDYPSLSRLVEASPDGDALLLEIGRKLASVGLCAEAVGAFIKAGDPRAAVDCCVALHQWDQAMELATDHGYPQVRALVLV
jgi:WD repeat-containing protein 35